jgi:hypothetical protein
MKWFSSLVLLLIFLSLTSSAQSEYYPSKPGLKWVYSNGETQTYTKTTNVFGVNAVILAHIFGGSTVQEDYIQVTSLGVNLIGTKRNGTVTQYKPPLAVYPAAPLAVGARWSSSSKVGSSVVAISSAILSSEGISVKGGRFNAFVIRQSVSTSSGGRSVSDLYFVPGIGTVRYVTADGTAVDLVSR